MLCHLLRPALTMLLTCLAYDTAVADWQAKCLTVHGLMDLHATGTNAHTGLARLRRTVQRARIGVMCLQPCTSVCACASWKSSLTATTTTLAAAVAPWAVVPRPSMLLSSKRRSSLHVACVRCVPCTCRELKPCQSEPHWRHVTSYTCCSDDRDPEASRAIELTNVCLLPPWIDDVEWERFRLVATQDKDIVAARVAADSRLHSCSAWILDSIPAVRGAIEPGAVDDPTTYM
jgi:hypothetical protein